MAKMNISDKICVTHEFRVSFPQVFTPKAYKNQDPEYSITMLFKANVDLKAPANEDTNSMRKAARNAAIEKWGPKENWPKKLKWPWRDGSEERPDTPGYAGHIFVRAACKADKGQPGLVNQKRLRITNESDFYAGCYARAELIAFAYEESGNRGVSFSLQNIQKTRDGEPFSGRRPAETVFGELEMDDDDDNEENEDDDDDGLGF